MVTYPRLVVVVVVVFVVVVVVVEEQLTLQSIQPDFMHI